VRSIFDPEALWRDAVDLLLGSHHFTDAAIHGYARERVSLEDVHFNDGAIATGTVGFGAGLIATDYDISVSGGALPGYEYTPASSNVALFSRLPYRTVMLHAAVNSGGTDWVRAFGLYWFEPSNAHAGDSFNLLSQPTGPELVPSLESVCNGLAQSSTCVDRLITRGQVLEPPAVPKPATLPGLRPVWRSPSLGLHAWHDHGSQIAFQQTPRANGKSHTTAQKQIGITRSVTQRTSRKGQHHIDRRIGRSSRLRPLSQPHTHRPPLNDEQGPLATSPRGHLLRHR